MAKRVGKKRDARPLPARPASSQASSPLITDAKLKQIYSAMLKCRILGLRLRGLREKNKSTAKSRAALGTEAVTVAATIDLRRGDWLAPSQGDILAGFLRGTSLASIFSESHPPASREVNSQESEKYGPLKILPPTVSLTAQLGIASGVAMAMKSSGKGSMVLVLCGDASTAGKSWQDALSFAGTHCLSLVVLVEVKAPVQTVSRQKTMPRNQIAEGKACGFPVIPVDAHDAVAMYRVAHESIHKARHGGGPTLIEATVFREQERSPAINVPQLPDAVARMEGYLTAKGIFSLSWKKSLVEKFNRDVDAAIEAVESGRN